VEGIALHKMTAVRERGGHRPPQNDPT